MCLWQAQIDVLVGLLVLYIYSSPVTNVTSTTTNNNSPVVSVSNFQTASAVNTNSDNDVNSVTAINTNSITWVYMLWFRRQRLLYTPDPPTPTYQSQQLQYIFKHINSSRNINNGRGFNVLQADGWLLDLVFISCIDRMRFLLFPNICQMLDDDCENSLYWYFPSTGWMRICFQVGWGWPTLPCHLSLSQASEACKGPRGRNSRS